MTFPLGKFSLTLFAIFAVSFPSPFLHCLVINDLEPFKCNKKLCICPDALDPVCASVSRVKKEVVTYKNPCLFLCDAKCLETQVSFFHCGQCDPTRNFTKIGFKGKAEDFACLKFNAKSRTADSSGSTKPGQANNNSMSTVAPNIAMPTVAPNTPKKANTTCAPTTAAPK